jgi:hypothetical protein
MGGGLFGSFEIAVGSPLTRPSIRNPAGHQLARRTPNILVNGNSILVTWDEQGRPWFECGRCGRRVRHIYLDALACRICLHLDYSSRHLHRSVPDVHRIMRWRRMIGVDPHPFAGIPERPEHHTASTASLREFAPKKVGWSGTSAALPATLSAARGFVVYCRNERR